MITKDDLMKELNEKDQRKLQKANLTSAEFENFKEFYELFKCVYSPSLIVKEFLQHKETITGITQLERKLRADGVISLHHRYVIRDLHRLQKHLKTPEDFDQFKVIYEKYKGKYGLNHIKHEYLKVKKGQAVA